MADARPTSKPWFLKLAALIFACILLEGLLITLCAVSPPVRWLLNPIRSGFEEDAQRGLRGNPDHPRHDAWGYSNSEVPDNADVVVIGDSQTYGITVARDEAWPQLVAKQTGLAVYNMGIPATGPIQYHDAIDEALRLNPQYVIIAAYLGNDLLDAFRYTYTEPVASALPDPQLAEKMHALEAKDSLIAEATLLFRRANGREPPGYYDLFVNHVVANVKLLSVLAATIREGVNLAAATDPDAHSWQQEKTLAQTRSEYVSVFDNGRLRTIFTAPYRAVAMNLEDPRIEESLAITLRALKIIQARSNASEAKVFLLNIPTKELVFAHEVDDPSEHVGLKAVLKHEQEVSRQLKQGAANIGLRILDVLLPLRQALRNSDDPPYDPSPNGHPNRTGNQVIANYVASILQAN
jgi:hypothetical protein